MPLIFLLDTSAASAPYIGQLNTCLNRFKAEVSQNSQAGDILDVAVIQFDDGVNVLSQLAPVANMRPARLITSGNAQYTAPIQEGLRMLADYSISQPNLYKPWIIMITGSRPTDDISVVAKELQNLQSADKLRFMALGVQNYNAAALKQLTDVVFKIDDTDFAPFFDWISKSMWAIAQTNPGEKPQLPPLQGNIYRDK